MRPVPTTSARRRAAGSVGEVIAERLGPVQVDVVQLVPGPRGVDVEEDPDAQRHGPGHGDLGGAEQRHGAEADLADGGGREDARTSAVAVKRMLTMSSSTSSLRSMSSRISSWSAR